MFGSEKNVFNNGKFSGSVCGALGYNLATKSSVYGIDSTDGTKQVLEKAIHYHGVASQLLASVSYQLSNHVRFYAALGVDGIVQHYFGNKLLDLSCFGKSNIGLLVNL